MLSYEQTARRFEEPTPEFDVRELDRAIAGTVAGPHDAD